MYNTEQFEMTVETDIICQHREGGSNPAALRSSFRSERSVVERSLHYVKALLMARF